MKRKVLYLVVLLMTTLFSNAQLTSVSLVGTGAGGWPPAVPPPGYTDPNQLTTVDGENWTITITLTAGEVKFRGNNSWDNNAYIWGGATNPGGFPTGAPASPGNNIQTVPGIRTVTFNSTTGVYNFEGAPIPVVKLVGAATSGDVTLATSDGVNFTASNVTLSTGDAQFDVDGTLTGGTGFPTGSAEPGSVSIPVAGGSYTTISLNLDNGEYTFTAAPTYPSIAIVGSATAQGWPNDPQVDAHVLSTTDGITYTGTIKLMIGALKFRQNNSWNPSWAGSSFPTGPDPANAGLDVAVDVPGYYDVTFNATTGAYAFSFPLISLTGDAFGGWGDGFDFDLTTTDGANYSIASITAVATNGGKFRSNHSWDAGNLAYGGAGWPSGTASTAPDAANIPVEAGIYGVTFNRETLAYNFGAPLATANFNKNADFRAYPNPTHNNWNFTSAKGAINTIQIVDVLGKIVLTVSPQANIATIDASGLNAGIYFAKVGTASATQTIKVVKN